MELKAYAKINLGLDVVRRREDGYHEVRMIMQSIGLYDTLDVSAEDTPGIRITTDNTTLPTDKDNLIYKAAKLLMDEYNIDKGLCVNLNKNIPIAAGLAGGSTDAAATMKAVNEIFGLGLSEDELMKRAVKIGADVPYCILGGTAISEGIGEILTPINPCPACHVLIAKPPVGVSTKYVYQNLQIDKIVHPDIDSIIEGISKSDIRMVADNLGNVLESVTVALHPVINDIKKMMTDAGAMASLMSGSGPTVFGMFTDKDDAVKCYELIKNEGIASDVVLTEMFNR